MFLWFVTLCASLKPLSSMVARLLYAGAFLYLAQHENHTELDLATSEKYATTTASTTSTSSVPTSTTTEFWPFQEEDSSADNHWDQDFFQEVPASKPPVIMDRSDPDPGPDQKSKSKLLITGVYKYERSSNFENYLKELGVSYVLRTLAGLATPVVNIARKCPKDAPPDAVDECQWTVRTDTLFKSHEVSFRLGQWGTDVTMDGRTIRFKVTPGEGESRLNRLVEVQEDGKVSTTLVRDFTEAGMTVTLKVNGVVASSFFSRQRLPG